jgi:hypothetical protein
VLPHKQVTDNGRVYYLARYQDNHHRALPGQAPATVCTASTRPDLNQPRPPLTAQLARPPTAQPGQLAHNRPTSP